MWLDYKRVGYRGFTKNRGIGSVTLFPLGVGSDIVPGMFGDINAFEFEETDWVWEDRYDI